MTNVPERWIEMGAQALRATDFDKHPVEHYLDDAEIVLEPFLADLRRQVEALPHSQWTFDAEWVLRDDVLALLDTGGSDE